MNGKSITVITGAAGMIGSAVVRKLNDMGHEDLILVDDLKQTEKWKNLVGKKFINIFSKFKILPWLKENEERVDSILHLGACSNTTETDADYLLENNFHFSISLAEWALMHNKRFIYASSAATYGDGSRGFLDDEAALDELRPLNMYGYSKQLVDLWMKRENVLKQVVGLKYFNVFGPNEYHKKNMASMVFKMAQVVENNGAIGLYKSNDLKNFKDGEQMRDFIYVKDAVEMTLAFWKKEHRHVGGIFNIGRGEPVTWNALATSLFDAYEKPKKIQYIEMPQELYFQYQNFTSAKMGKFHKTFGEKLFQPRAIPLAVQDYVQNYLVGSKRW